jgi:prepilin-type N-terminal cleavage/methylation domain-containing protein
MKFRSTQGTDGGMTLLEVMMATSVLLVCLTALATVLGTSITSSQTAKIRDEATNLANERIESARSLAYDRVGLHYANGTYGDPVGDIVTPETVGQFTVTSECTWVRTSTGRAAYKQLTVHVAWTSPTPGQVAVTTMIYGKSDIVTSGDLVVKLRYREDATPVSGAGVAVVASDNSARAVASDASGESFFGQLALGAVGLSVTAPSGCVVDTSTISNVNIVADALTTVIVYVQHPAAATVHVTDTGGAALSGATVTLRRADGVVLPAVLTGASGDAVFSALLYSTYSATVQATGYTSATVPVAVSVGAPNVTAPASISKLLGVGIRVRVFDANGATLPNATVTLRISGNSTVIQTGNAGSSGDISFTGLSANTYAATVDLSGYTSQAKTTALADGNQVTLAFNMVPVVSNGTMSITTLDKNGRVAAVRVIVSGPGYYHNDLYSNSSGYLYLSSLPAGSYQVQCYTKPASTATVIVSGGQTAAVQISQTR